MKRFDLHTDDCVLHIYTNDFTSLTTLTEATLDEARRRGEPLYGPYSVQDHEAHAQPGEDHLHVYWKNNQLFALNKGTGTAHDQSHGIKIPNKLAKALQQKFPDLKLPPNNFIESASTTDEIAVTLAEAGEL
ncbi:MAG TPA: hypothetical protein VGY75_00495 [Candidatus Udaeobacter sp.]|jgi:hypothetical protein|nr:hypothetical protein [Candidatus Udaeobacter sp.]